MANEQYYLVINLGLRSIRALLFNKNIEVIEKNWYPIQTKIHNDMVEQSPHEWWELCSSLITGILSKNTLYGEKLQSITVTASSCCLVVLDKKGVPLMNAMMVSDTRAQGQAKKIHDLPEFKSIFKNKNNLPSPSFMIPKMLWLKENNPRIFKGTRYFMGANDFFIYKLTSINCTDELNAEKFYYDTKKKQYSKKLVSYLKINPNQLPRVMPVGTTVGSVNEIIAQKFHISPHVSVTITSYDAICAFIGSGASKEGDMCNVCGTVSSARVLTKKKISNKGGILSQKCMNFSIVGGSNNIDGGLLEWAKQMFYGDSYSDKFVYNIMENEATDSPLGARGLIFSPYIIGERVPFVDPNVRGIFFGLERFHKRNDIMRSIFEASSYMIYDIMSQIEKSGVKVNSIRMSGGLTQNRIACKIRADVTGKKIIVLDEIETTSLGALFIMLLTTDRYNKLSDLTKKLKTTTVFLPNMKNHAIYKKYFELFKKIYNNNKILMYDRKNLLKELHVTDSYILENL